MNNYLLQLLKEVNMIIIPGLGAMNLVNKTTGEIMFMPYMKHDDGALANHISEKEGMDLNDAKNLVSKFVREVSAILDKGESYDMYQFGSFKKDGSDVSFTQNTNVISESIETHEEKIISVLDLKTEEIIDPISVQKENIEIPLDITNLVEEKLDEAEKQTIEPIEFISNSTIENEFKSYIPENHSKTNLDEILGESTLEKTIESNISIENTTESNVVDEEIFNVKEPEVTIENNKLDDRIDESFVESKETKTIKSTTRSSEKTNKSSVTPSINKIEPQKKGSKSLGFWSYLIWGLVIFILGGATFVALKYDQLIREYPAFASLMGENKSGPSTVLADEVVNNGLEEKEEMKVEKPARIEKEIVQQEVKKELVEEIVPVKKNTEETVKITKRKKIFKPTKVNSETQFVNGSNDPVISLDGSKPFHIIAGSFSNEANATRFAKAIKQKGFGNVSMGQNGGSYRVSVQGFSSKEEALSEMNSIKASIPSAWLCKI